MFFAVHDGVEHAVFEEEFAALESFGKFLSDGLFDDARAGESDQRARFGDVEVAEHGIRSGDAAGGRVGQDGDVRNSGVVEARQTRRRFSPSASG